MRRFLPILFTILIMVFVRDGWATTYFKNWVNNSQSNTMVQGDFYAWEYDVSQVGGSAHFSLYVDVNGDQSLDGGDVLLIEFDQTDGETGEGGPGDSSSVADGIIYSFMGYFGLAPADYIMQIEDLNDQSTVTGHLHIDPPATVNITLSGQLSMEGVTPPDSRLANFMLEAEPSDDESGTFWSALTDENGHFSVNLPDSAVDDFWKLSFMFSNQVSSYVPDPESYHDIMVSTGDNSGYDFFLGLPGAWVYGDIVDETGQLVAVSGWGSLENQHSYQETEFIPDSGHFNVAAPFEGDDTLDVPFRLSFWSDALVPDYLIPNTWDNPDYQLTLSIGDSVRKDIRVWSADTVIYAMAIKDSALLSDPYEVQAWNETYGQTFTALQGDIARLHVRHGVEYEVSLSNTEDGDLQPPPGYYLDGGNHRTAFPGDTVRFIFRPSQHQLFGRISFEQGDPVSNLENCSVQAFTPDWQSQYDGTIDADSLTFSIAVPSDTLNVRFNCWDGDYLAYPTQYENIVVDTTDVDTLDFLLNYTHANLVVKLINAPVENAQDYWMYISTEGEFPYIYEESQPLQADSAVYFRVCEGNWVITAPYLGENFIPDKPDTVVQVTEGKTEYYVEFKYTGVIGIEEKEPIPTSFYVSQNYPNPFGENGSVKGSPSTTISFGLPQQQFVKVEIYNVVGQKVATLADGTLPAGIHRLKWNGSNFPSGMYFYRVVTPNKTVVRRMLLLK